MATVRAFRALRPDPAVAARVAAVPYDVVDTNEARDLAADPLSFLHVSRAEIDLPQGTDPHADVVYREAAKRYRLLKETAPFLQEDMPALYLYRLEAAGHSQTGLGAVYSLDEYDTDIIKKHERTRRDKEDDRTRHIFELRAQTGPVFLTYRPDQLVNDLSRRVKTHEPIVDFVAIDRVRHSIWLVRSDDARAIEQAFTCVKTLYIADGHHRAASAARARQRLPGSRDAGFFLGVAFPSDEVRILPYNRVVRDLGGKQPPDFLAEVARHFAVKGGSATPERKGEASMYVEGAWHRIDLGSAGTPGPAVVDSLDCNILQEKLLTPILGIQDVRIDPRIDFVGGARGTAALERMVDGGRAAVAFSMYPVSGADLMDVSDAGAIMPPKSTWFEPKLRDGLLIHEI
ncbi:MAG: DUF1015 family protein [Vicinamibacterales bacterium]|nr:DUF1015 family protein [Vicinamibacterales bacterium]